MMMADPPKQVGLQGNVQPSTTQATDQPQPTAIQSPPADERKQTAVVSTTAMQAPATNAGKAIDRLNERFERLVQEELTGSLKKEGPTAAHMLVNTGAELQGHSKAMVKGFCGTSVKTNPFLAKVNKA